MQHSSPPPLQLPSQPLLPLACLHFWLKAGLPRGEPVLLHRLHSCSLPWLPAQCYLVTGGTGKPDRLPQGPRWTSLIVPADSILLGVPA